MRTEKLLALNMIVGEGDGDYLERCLKSCNALIFFDEIVILRTTEDERVKEVCDIYATKHLYSPWVTKEFPYGNFGEARNKPLRNSECKYVMWLDSDDTLDPAVLPAINEIREILNHHDFDFIKCPYHLEIDKNGNPMRSLIKARIFKRGSGIEWKFPIHEQLTIDFSKHKSATINNLIIQHRKETDPKYSIKRNLNILKSELEKDDSVSHTRYFYAKELVSDFISNRNKESKDKAIEIFSDIVLNEKGSEYEILHSSIECAVLLYYNPFYKIDERGLPVNLSQEDINKAETFSRIALSISENYSEPLCILGDIYFSKKEYDNAFNFYVEAGNKSSQQEGGIQRTSFYFDIPHFRLLYLYKETGKFEEALVETRRLLFQKGCMISKEKILKEREEIINTIMDVTRKYVDKLNESIKESEVK